MEEETPNSPKSAGLITILISFIFSAAGIVMSGIDFQVLNVKWNKSLWRHLGLLKIISTSYSGFVCLIGILVFTSLSHSKGLIGLYEILLILCILFSLAIGIFCSIGGTIYHKVDHIIGCDSELTGILKLWENIDEYFIYANSIICTDLCVCEVNKDVENEFLNNYFTTENYKKWNVKITSDKKKFNIRNCQNEMLESIYKLYNSNPNNTKIHITNINKFFNYWEGIEKRFKCTGWCRTKYTNPYTLKNDTMIKYIFSDINRGVPLYPGCINRLVNWIPSLVGTVGACLITSSLLQIINLLFTFKLMSTNIDDSMDEYL